jgi:hypothetical protein
MKSFSKMCSDPEFDDATGIEPEPTLHARFVTGELFPKNVF